MNALTCICNIGKLQISDIVFLIDFIVRVIQKLDNKNEFFLKFVWYITYNRNFYKLMSTQFDLMMLWP